MGKIRILYRPCGRSQSGWIQWYTFFPSSTITLRIPAIDTRTFDENGNKLRDSDIVVGSPHGGRDKRGAVYILHGSKDGIREKHTQKIEAASVNSNVRGFGFSVAGGVDVDANGMPGTNLSLILIFNIANGGMRMPKRYRLSIPYLHSLQISRWEQLDPVQLLSCCRSLSSL